MGGQTPSAYGHPHRPEGRIMAINPGKPPLFAETQRFRHPLLWVSLLGGVGVYLMALLRGMPGGSSEQGLELGPALAGGGTLLLVILFFWTLRLETRLDDEGVYVRLPPLSPRGQRIPWREVDRAWVRSYRPIREYGGWGIRMGLGGRGRAWNVQGNTGLQLVLKDGRRILVGTARGSQLRVVLSGLVARGILRPAEPRDR